MCALHGLIRLKSCRASTSLVERLLEKLSRSSNFEVPIRLKFLCYQSVPLRLSANQTRSWIGCCRRVFAECLPNTTHKPVVLRLVCDRVDTDPVEHFLDQKVVAFIGYSVKYRPIA